MRCPQEASGSAQSLVPCGGGREKVSTSVQSTASALQACLYCGGMLASSRSSQIRGRVAGGQAIGVVFGQGAGDQAEGALGLPVGELVRAGLPVLGHAEPGLVGGGQGDQRVADPGQVRGPLIGLGQQHAGQQGADPQLPVAHPDRQ